MFDCKKPVWLFWKEIASLEYTITGMILGLRPANDRRRCIVMTSLIGWVQT